MKGGRVLRKAWKTYQKTYGQVRAMYMREVGLQGNSIGKTF